MTTLIGIVVAGVVLKILGSVLLNAAAKADTRGDYNKPAICDGGQIDNCSGAGGRYRRCANEIKEPEILSVPVPDLISRLGANVPEENIKPGHWYNIGKGQEIMTFDSQEGIPVDLPRS